MSKLQMQSCNEFGIHIRGDQTDRFYELKLYPENGHVNMYATINLDNEDNQPEALMYLSPEEAMKLANALQASAMEALRSVTV